MSSAICVCVWLRVWHCLQVDGLQIWNLCFGASASVTQAVSTWAQLLLSATGLQSH